MAIFSLHVKPIQRSKGHSAVAACAYRHGIALTDERTGITHDYSKRMDAIYNELSIPENSPQWVKDIENLSVDNPNLASSQLWNHVERVENRKDAQPAREIRIALPIELSALQNVELTRDYVQSQLTKMGMIADWSIHFDVGNPHVHILLTFRALNQDGFGDKVRGWNRLCQEWRVKWEEHANHHLKMHGHDVRIDHRSNQARGIDIVPTKHLGKTVIEQQRRGKEIERYWELRDIQRENLNRIHENPGILFDAISHETSTFSTEKVAQTLSRYVNPHDGEFSVFTSDALNTRQQDYSDAFSPHADVIRESLLNESTDEVVQNKKPLTSFEKILQAIEKHESVFSARDVARAVSDLTPDADVFAKTLIKVNTQLRQNTQVIRLGLGDDGRERFTTRHFFNMENEAIDLSIQESGRKHASIKPKDIKKALRLRQIDTGKTLTEEQYQALLHLTKSSGLSCMVGRAGTGKSFTVGSVREVYELAGFNVQGIALSGVAADGLARDAGIPSRTIESFKLAFENDPSMLNDKSVLIMDEAGMTDSISMLGVLKVVHQTKAKLILLGDPDQLQPVGPGALFRGILERLGYAQIQTIYRQVADWQKVATLELARGEVESAITAYEEKGYVHFERTDIDAMNRLVADWKMHLIAKNNLAEQLVITYRNQDVQQLNTLLRQTLVESGRLSEGYQVQTNTGIQLIAKDERILFLKNNRWLGVSNGRFATVTSVDFLESGKVRSFNVLLDGQDKPITINPEQYQHFDYGYAATVHKTQGVTKDATFVYVTQDIWNRALTYVAMTRHRISVHLYASKTSFESLNLLKRSLQKFKLKDSVLDFPLAFAARRGIEPNTQGFSHHVAQKLHAITDKITHHYQQWRDPIAYEQSEVRKTLLAKRNTLRQDAKIVADYADCRLEIGKQWQRIQESLKAQGLNAHHLNFNDTAKALPEYVVMSEQMAYRDALAAQIYPKADYHALAIELNRLDLNTIAKHAATHKIREKLQAYQMALKNNQSLIAQKIAFQLSPEIKKYYALMKTMGIDTAGLTHHAKTYHQRIIKTSLLPEERKAFDRVALYQDLLKQSAPLLSKLSDFYHAEKHPKACLVLQEKLIALNLQKSRIAAQILKDRQTHANGLDYFEIGKGINLAHAQKRWYQLQKSASFHKYNQHKIIPLPLDLQLNKSQMPVESTSVINAQSRFIDLARLKTDLNEQAETIALHYLGQPKKQMRGQYRYGDKNGSLFVTLTGSKQGRWYDFQTAEGGDMLSLISHTTGFDFKETLKEAVEFLGGASHYISNEMTLTASQIAAREKKQQAMIMSDTAEQAKKLQHVQLIAKDTRPIQGTLAERYLREHRGIQGEFNSDNLTYHPALKNWVTGTTHPALVILARDTDNNITGIQATFLSENTANKAPIDKAAIKLSRGTICQGSIVHHSIVEIVEENRGNVERCRSVVALAEGLETALSVADAHPDWEVRLTFGVSNFERSAIASIAQKNLQKNAIVDNVVNVDSISEKQPTIIICADNDGINSGTAKAVKKAVDNLNQQDIKVNVVEPEKPAHIEKWDFNDALKTYGVDIVRVGINKNLPESLIGNSTPEYIPYTATQKTYFAQEQETSRIEEKSLASLLINYIGMEQKQKELVFANYEARSGSDRTIALEANTKLHQHHAQLKAMAHELNQREDVQALIAEARRQRYYTNGPIDFEAMKTDLSSGNVNLSTIHPLLKALRQKVNSMSLSRQQSRGRRC